MATAWFQTHGLPCPGALGIYSVGSTPNRPGDGSYTAAPIGEDMPPPLDFGKMYCLPTTLTPYAPANSYMPILFLHDLLLFSFMTIYKLKWAILFAKIQIILHHQT